MVMWSLQGQIYTHTKSRDYENLRALENRSQAEPWEVRIHFCSQWALECSVTRKWTMLKDHNICLGVGPLLW